MISKNRYITLRIEHISFSIGIYHITALVKLYNIILKRPHVRAVLHKSVRINKVLMVVFELPYSITAGCLYIVDTGRHQFVNHSVDKDIAENRRQNGFYSLLG